VPGRVVHFTKLFIVGTSKQFTVNVAVNSIRIASPLIMNAVISKILNKSMLRRSDMYKNFHCDWRIQRISCISYISAKTCYTNAVSGTSVWNYTLRVTLTSQ